jgi:rod shape-determining protein MreD
MQLSDAPASQRILLPVRASTIIVSLVLALFANFLPWRSVLYVPDFVALVLCFWCIRQPRLVGLGAAWVLGLLTDVGNGVLMGQHGLSYALLAFACVTLSRRILWFSLLGQALHVGALLVFAQAVAALVRIAAGAEFPGWQIAIGPMIGMVLWPVVTHLLLLPQRMPTDVDENRAL